MHGFSPSQGGPAAGMPSYGGNQGVPGSAGIPGYAQPQGGPNSAGPMSSYSQTPTTPQSSAGRGFPPQGGFQGGYNAQGYGNIGMPGSAGAYGQDQNSTGGWGQQRGGPNNGAGAATNYGHF